MIRPILSVVLLAAVLAGAGDALAEGVFRAPRLAPAEAAALGPLAAKSAAAEVDASGRLRVASVRDLAKAAPVQAWTPLDGGYVARLRASAEGARGLRVKLDLGRFASTIEVRVQGDGGPIETMTVDPALAREAWTPWTEGAAQVIEIFSPAAPAAEAVRIGAVLHFTASPFAKAAASCTLSTACPSGDGALDALIAERKKSVAKIQFVSGASGFVCSATLIDTPRRPSPYVLTANHCVDDAASASTVTAFWFYEESACGSATPSAVRVQTASGMQLVFTSFNADATLLLMNESAPAGTAYAPVNAARLGEGQSAVSISHPRGDTSRWATGTTGAELRDADRPYDMYSVNFARGIIEPGSSGSGLFTNANGRLELRGILSQGALGLSCSQPTLFTLYGRMDVFYPQMAQYVGAMTVGADDAPNRPQDAALAVSGPALDALAQPVVLQRRIDYGGDIDVFRFTLAAPAWVSAYTRGADDTVGTFLDANGAGLEANDDAQRGDTNTGITRRLEAGTYFFSVGHWDPAGTGDYELNLRADKVDANYTALWWNAAESGWGLNVNHQGDILFATLFTYERDGTPLWLVMSNGNRQADGSYSGVLRRTTGPAFNAAPWRSIGQTDVGTMRLAFSGPDAGTLTYTYAGSTVTKSITRQTFRTPPTCTWSAFDRSWETNFQDLWWNPAENGWGLNLTHQGDVVFATLFTYGADGRGIWLVMSEGLRDASGNFSGTLYRTTGSAFDAPWRPSVLTPVGTLTLSFTSGNAGTLAYTVDGIRVTKSIERQVFATPRPKCES